MSRAKCEITIHYFFGLEEGLTPSSIVHKYQPKNLPLFNHCNQYGKLVS